MRLTETIDYRFLNDKVDDMLSLKYHTTCMPSIPLQPEVTKKQDVGEQGCNNALYDRHPFF